MNLSLDDAVNILTATSKICLKIKIKRFRKRIKRTSDKKWFDHECRLKRHELRKLSNQKHRDPLNSGLREKFHKTLNDYKKLLDSKRKEFQEDKTLQLDELALNPDKASFWSCLKSMNDTQSQKKRGLIISNPYIPKTRQFPCMSMKFVSYSH